MVLVLKVVNFEVRGPLRISIHQISERTFTKFRVSTHQISDQTSTKFSNKESTRKKSAYNQEYCNNKQESGSRLQPSSTMMTSTNKKTGPASIG